MAELTHIDHEGHAQMVDVSTRPVTTRSAQASAQVITRAAAAIKSGSVPKGDVLATARIAGIMGAKRTPDLIPLCHPIAVHAVEVKADVDAVADSVWLHARVVTADRTGVEMEALTAVSIAALTIIDMVKSIDPAARIANIQIEAKDGGKNGSWTR